MAYTPYFYDVGGTTFDILSPTGYAGAQRRHTLELANLQRRLLNEQLRLLQEQRKRLQELMKPPTTTPQPLFSQLPAGQPQTLREEPLLTPMQKRLGGALEQAITPQLRTPLAFMPTPYEMAGLEMLRRRELPPMIQTAATEEMLRTFMGGYNPYASPYYQTMRQQLEQAGKEAMSSLLSNLARQGLIGETTNVRAALPISELQGKITGGIAQLIAQVAERERERQLRTLPYAMQLTEMLQRFPLQRAELLARYGRIPRETALIPYEMAMKMWGRNVPYGIKEFQYTPLFGGGRIGGQTPKTTVTPTTTQPKQPKYPPIIGKGLFPIKKRRQISVRQPSTGILGSLQREVNNALIEAKRRYRNPFWFMK